MKLKGAVSFFLVAAGLFWGNFSASEAWAGPLEDAIAKGNAHAEKREYEKAIEEYRKALAQSPQNPKVNLLLGLAYASAGDLDRAIQYTQASASGEASFSAYHHLGLIYANRREPEKAIDAYRKALEMSPLSFRAWYQLGLVYASDLKFKEAIEAYGKVIEINPRFTDAYLGLGSAHYWAGNKNEALAQVAKLRELRVLDKAKALEDWITNKEEKKQSARKKLDERTKTVSSPAESGL
jgi:tetratricopeptide (TPR) repeat protein